MSGAGSSPGPVARYDELDLRDPGAVAAVFSAGAAANLGAACRRGSVDVVEGGRLIATGDLHDNPLHMARVVRAAGLGEEAGGGAHLTLHEVIHGENLVNGMDFSFRALARVAALKAAHPERVHTLLANHELSQIVGAGVIKDGVNCVRAFNEAMEYSFGDEAAGVAAALGGFIRSMPLALRCVTIGGEGDVLCAHSLPGPDLMDRFDAGVLERGLTEEDYEPRRGSAHIMVWGRGQTPELLAELAARWGVSLFVLGHEKADDGVAMLGADCVVLNSDHSRGAYLDLELAGEVTGASVPGAVRFLAQG